MPQASRGKNRSSKRRKQRWLLGAEMKRKYEIRSVLPGLKAMVKTKGGGEKTPKGAGWIWAVDNIITHGYQNGDDVLLREPFKCPSTIILSLTK